MARLSSFYRLALRWLVLLIAVAAFAAAGYLSAHAQVARSSTLQPWLDSMLFHIVRLVTSTGVVTAVFTLGEYLIRTVIWKWAHPDCDYSGVWIGISTYLAVEVESPSMMREGFKPFSSAHPVAVIQDCTRVAIGRKGSLDYARWYSLVCELTDNNELNFAYEVEYLPTSTPRFPIGLVKGYESMSVDQWHDRFTAAWLPKWARRKLPIVLRGSFEHCVHGQSPVYRGNTIFVRLSHLGHATLSSEQSDLIEEAFQKYPALRTNS